MILTSQILRNVCFSIAVVYFVVAIDIYNVFSKFIIPEPELVSVQQIQPIVQPVSIPEPEQIKSPSPVIDTEELICMATNIYHEARGESIQGQIAVAHVTNNRVKSPRFPNTVCGVVYQAVYSTWWYETHGRIVPVKYKCQFTWFCDGKSDVVDTSSSSWKVAKRISLEVLYNDTPDVTNGSTHYFNHHLVNPYWADHMTYVATIQNHSFYIH